MDKGTQWALFEPNAAAIPQQYIAAGILHILVSLAPLQPAEFVIVTIDRLPKELP